VTGEAPGPAGRVRTLVVEDEAPARERLLELLREVPWVEVVGVAADGPAATAALDALRPALVLLDVRLPECSGLEALERATHRPAVVFTTAYDRHAVAAFALGAVDYLLKPFGRDRLVAALERVRRTLPATATPADAPAGAAAGEPPRASAPGSRSGPGAGWSGCSCATAGRLVPVLLREVERLEAEDDYVALVVAGRRFLVELPLGEFAERLDPRRFLRIHRAHIVNLDFVRQLVPYDGAGSR
jgi:two-component system LytT family response regulator